MSITGIGWTSARLADGSRVFYYRVTREKGAPVFWKSSKKVDYRNGPVPKEFALAYAAAMKQWENERPARETHGDCARFIAQYLASDKFEKRAPSTKKQYRSLAEKVEKAFGSASIEVIEDRRFRGRLIDWHETQARRSPKMADDMVQVLSNALEYAFRRGALLRNPASGIEKAYTAPDDKRPIPQHEIDAALAIGRAVDLDVLRLGLFTGLRAKDLAEITWDADKGTHIEWATSKSRRKNTAIIPLTREARAFLDDLRARQMRSRRGMQRTMLLGTKGRSMTPGYVSQRMGRLFDRIGSDATCHRFRNSFATLLVRAGFSDEEIGAAVGWSAGTVREMKAIYVQREEIVAAQVARLDVARNRNGN